MDICATQACFRSTNCSVLAALCINIEPQDVRGWERPHNIHSSSSVKIRLFQKESGGWSGDLSSPGLSPYKSMEYSILLKTILFLLKCEDLPFCMLSKLSRCLFNSRFSLAAGARFPLQQSGVMIDSTLENNLQMKDLHCCIVL